MKKACLIFPLLFRDRDYDECAHGWLDGLNRLFMEAKLSLFLVLLQKLIYAAVFPPSSLTFPKTFCM